MNRQEAFEKAYKGIVAQGCRSHDGVFCVYRGPNDTKCAVGHLLTDEQIEKHAIKNSDGALYFPRALTDELLPNDNNGKYFLAGLQAVHDGMESLDDFKARATEFAKSHNLTVPE